MEYKIGDWVEIVSHGVSSLGGYCKIGDVVKIINIENSSTYHPNKWIIYKDSIGKKREITTDGVRPAKNKIVTDILMDL